MPTEPTNADLFVAIENNNEAFLKHADDDFKTSEKQAKVNEKTKESLDSLHIWKETVATKEDIRELKDFMKQVNFSIGFFKFTWNNAAKIGAFFLLVGGIFIFFKMGLAAAFAFLFGKQL